MKRIRVLLASVLVVALCIPLAGCDDVSESASTVLQAFDVAYKGVMNGSAAAHKKGFITKDTVARVAHYAAIYHSSWKSACTALEEYESAATKDKEVKRIALDAAMNLARTRLVELTVYWNEAKGAYKELKDG